MCCVVMISLMTGQWLITDNTYDVVSSKPGTIISKNEHIYTDHTDQEAVNHDYTIYTNIYY